MDKGRLLHIIILALVVASFCSCYHKRQNVVPHNNIVDSLTQEQADSARFTATHHYGRNFNFVVSADSLILYREQPEEIASGVEPDSFSVKHNSRVAVADYRVMRDDSLADSVWIQIATTQPEFGWIQESKLLKHATPDDPISQFISTFSDTHTLISLMIVILVVVAFTIRRLLKKEAKIVHFNDIDSFYPTILALLVASSAALYASIQMFEPGIWQNFYFHPSLNPFSEPRILCVFICLVWAMLITTGAVIDDVLSLLSFNEAILYLCGLAAVCAVDYIVFSVLTLYYIGYPLLVAYFGFAIWRYKGRQRVYRCGNCGAILPDKHAKCPKCGTVNE